tara:strand:- start:18828 stop:22502 length:3675 start_codon:yes stop_codon:yes gene_type:complete
MRIAIDLQGIQSDGSRNRGIGRYSLELVRNIIKNGSNNHYVLVGNAALFDVRDFFKNEISQKNVDFLDWYTPCPVHFQSNNTTKLVVGRYLKSYFFSCLNVDIILLTSFLEGFSENFISEIDDVKSTTKVFSIFYDLIPLLNPTLYLKRNPEFSKFYHKKINGFNKLDGLLAISYSSAKEIITNLNIDKNRVFNISSACDNKIFNTDRLIQQSDSINFSKTGSFILYTGACDPRKNIKNLLKAYSLLDSKILKQYKLVIAGSLIQPELDLLASWKQEFKIADQNVISLGYVSDDDLVLLYRKCSLFIFPSFHEGFGLPVLEAMCCGAPVIASNKTSIPEVIENKNAMFNPYNPKEISVLINKALTNKTFNNELLINAKIQSQKFSWTRSSLAALKAFQTVLEKNVDRNRNFTWSFINDLYKSNLDDLLKKLTSNKLLKKNFLDSDWKLLAASIDKNNQQLDSFVKVNYGLSEIKKWKVEGPFDSTYSLSILNRCFAEALSRKVKYTSLKITEGPGDYHPNEIFLKNYPQIFSIYKNSLNDQNFTEIVSRNLYPPRVSDLASRFNLLHSYGWEESEFPKNWVNDFNNHLQGMTVMSNQVKKILIDNGVTIPIYVAGLGLDHIQKIKPDCSINNSLKKFKILHISSCFPRKGIDILIKAYEKVFNNKDDVSLIIKTFSNPHNNVKELLYKAKNSNPNFPHVELLECDLTDSQIKALYLNSDLFIAPSRGEGFGLPLGEAMYSRVPVITTGWGGQLDFCNNENCWLIDFKFVNSKSHFDLDFSYWAEPSVNHLASLISRIYHSPKQEIQKKIDTAFDNISKLDWDLVIDRNLEFVRSKLCKFSNQKSKIACISTWNRRCGIASYARNIFTSFRERVTIFSPLEDYNTSDDDDFDVIPSWSLDPSLQDFSCLLEHIREECITSIVIQFNYGFYDFTQLSNLIYDLKRSKINIILLMHSTKDPDHDKTKKLSLIISSLRLCNRIIVHTISDLNRLKNLNIVDNVCLLPQGILHFNSKNNFLKSIKKSLSNEIYSIASYGFCLPNKGFKELIKAIFLLNNRGIRVRLNIYSALYNDEYNWYYEELQNLVTNLNLGGSVFIHDEYMQDQETLHRLSCQDCLVFPYQSSNESSSAAVRHGLASLVPVLVTPHPIFDDISEIVYKLSGFTPEDIANGIEEFYIKNKDYIYKSATTNDQQKRNNIISSMHFSKISYRFYNIIKSLEINEASNTI